MSILTVQDLKISTLRLPQYSPTLPQKNMHQEKCRKCWKEYNPEAMKKLFHTVDKDCELNLKARVCIECFPKIENPCPICQNPWYETYEQALAAPVISSQETAIMSTDLIDHSTPVDEEHPMIPPQRLHQVEIPIVEEQVPAQPQQPIVHFQPPIENELERRRNTIKKCIVVVCCLSCVGFFIYRAVQPTH